MIQVKKFLGPVKDALREGAYTGIVKATWRRHAGTLITKNREVNYETKTVSNAIGAESGAGDRNWNRVCRKRWASGIERRLVGL